MEHDQGRYHHKEVLEQIGHLMTEHETVWILYDRGCYECGEDDTFIAVFKSEEAAKVAMSLEAEHNTVDVGRFEIERSILI